jgi:hypothetical protein
MVSDVRAAMADDMAQADGVAAASYPGLAREDILEIDTELYGVVERLDRIASATDGLEAILDDMERQRTEARHREDPRRIGQRRTGQVPEPLHHFFNPTESSSYSDSLSGIEDLLLFASDISYG